MKTGKATSFAALFAILALTGWGCQGPGAPYVAPDSGDGSPDTADWQTFRDETYGVEFKYPEGWMEIPDTAQTLSLLVVGFNAADDDSPEGGITFSVDSKTLAESLVGFDSDPDMEVLQREEVSVGGIQWVKDISRDRNTPLQFLAYITEHGGKTYEFDIVYAGASPEGLTNERDTAVLNGILNTFHFVE